MPGVKIIAEEAFADCHALTDVECGNVEIIENRAFLICKSLGSINLPSARIVEECAFNQCDALTDVKFGSKLERIDYCAFFSCTSLERITIPLKDGIIFIDNIFEACACLMHVDLVEGELHETIAALQLEEWRNDMNEEIDSINRILPSARAGGDIDREELDPGEKAQTIRTWISSVLGKIIRYQAEHQLLLNEASSTIHLALPQDIVMNNVLPFLKLPTHAFELGDDDYYDTDDSMLWEEDEEVDEDYSML